MWSSSFSINARRRLVLGALLAAATVASAPSVAAADWRTQLPQAQAVGGGDLRWFGLRIYHATLWSASRPFDAAQPFALQLSYYRSISRERLVSTSMEEIRRLSPVPIAAATLARWEAQLSNAFVDVRDGDELTGVYLPGNGMRLYDRQRLLAELNDEALARAFFDIWLNPDSRDPTLRLRLLGTPP
ncbi:Chalcone isomerase-like [Duganella sacchari]|uniref:Chalcone isomerase-like n=1 Tax=Duganella sacchari TaxID=551987 RepID=A0A1M7R4B0_9BURK|nr:chalcone isomerase family protein [Duganella sacchari]SHN40019.1 Chalcone isomerase-like [Duganella sacchari]